RGFPEGDERREAKPHGSNFSIPYRNKAYEYKCNVFGHIVEGEHYDEGISNHVHPTRAVPDLQESECESKHVPWIDIPAGATQGCGAEFVKMMRHGARIASAVGRTATRTAA